MSSWVLLQLKEGLYSNVSGEHVTCLNNGIYVKKWVALYLESSMIETLQLSLLLFTVRSLCSFISCREGVEGIIKKTWQFSEKVEYNAIKVLPFKANNSIFMLFTALCVPGLCFSPVRSHSWGRIQNV